MHSGEHEKLSNSEPLQERKEKVHNATKLQQAFLLEDDMDSSNCFKPVMVTCGGHVHFLGVLGGEGCLCHIEYSPETILFLVC